MPTTGEVATLQAVHGLTWAAIEGARERAIQLRNEIGQLVREARAIPQDAGFVVFGSLAREEATEGSDVDWALLVDGPADDDHSSTGHTKLQAADVAEVDLRGWFDCVPELQAAPT